MKKWLAMLTLVAVLLSSYSVSAISIQYYGKEKNKNLTVAFNATAVLKNGTAYCEAEECSISEAATIISDKKAFGGLAVKLTPAANETNSADNISRDTLTVRFKVPKTYFGVYKLWIRMKTPSNGSDSFYSNFTGNMARAYTTQWCTVNTEYYWRSFAVGITDEEFDFKIKYRESGVVFDRFILTDDEDFVPDDTDKLPTSYYDDEVIKTTLYPVPRVTPPSGHPRLMITSDLIPQIKANKEHPILAPMFGTVSNYAHETLNGKLPSSERGYNYSASLAFKVQCRAYMYLLGEVDISHAKETVRIMKDMFDTIEWDTSIGDVTRNIGTFVATSAIVYDWCYDVLSDSDKTYFIENMKKNMRLMESGYPPVKSEEFTGHGGEGELFYYQLSVAIATYDEEPEIYNNVAGRLFDEFFESRKYFNKTGLHPVGNAYGATRLQWEALCQILFDRMGYPNIMGDQMDQPAYRWIYDRLPQGNYVEDGDSFLYWTTAKGPYYFNNDAPVMLMCSYFNDDPYLRGEYIKQLSLRGYSPDMNICGNGIQTLLLFDPTKPYAYPDDGNLPLTYTSSYPLTSVFARTSWQAGMESETAVAFMKGQEKLVNDHNHHDIGNFILYYKGTLALHGGTYQGTGGGYGSGHDMSYYKRTISKNCMTVFDPNEISKPVLEQADSSVVSNDGGQVFRHLVDSFDGYLKKEDEAATEGLYVGPNEITPEFSYLKTNLTNAYSDKVSGYTRSMVMLNLFNTDYPMAFICYDNITSSDKNFKKTWNLQTVNMPQTTGNVTTVERDDYEFSGKLVLKTMLPEEDDVVFTPVGGEGKESYVNGVNYESKDYDGYDNEQGNWRLEISPKLSKNDDLFLNSMYVTDSNKNLPELPMIQEETKDFVGVTVMDRTVLFSKTRDAVSENFTFSLRNNGYDTMSVLVTDISAGTWAVSNGKERIVVTVKEGENALYARLAPGDYTFLKADGEKANSFTYEVNPNISRVGDFWTYDTNQSRFYYNEQPTVLKDGVPYVCTEFLQKLGAKVQTSGNQVTITKEGKTVTLLCENINGKSYVNPLGIPVELKLEFKYDPLARILKVTKKASAEPFKDVLDIDKIIEPIYFEASSNDGNVPSNLFDYNLATRWSASGDSEYLICDYGSIQDIDSIYISFMSGDQRSAIFDITVSDDGIHYTTVNNCRSSGTTTEPERFEVDAKARYVKLLCYGNSAGLWNSYNELITIAK